MSKRNADWRPETLAVALGRPSGAGAPLNTPPTMSSTFLDGGDSLYSRMGNPSYSALEEAIGALEGGIATCFASGMAAVAAVIEQLPVGAKVVTGRNVYQGTKSLLADLATRGRARQVAVDVADDAVLAAELADADLLFVETPSNPLIEVLDLTRLSAAARAANVPLVVDNTFATPLLQNPLALGADAVVHSVTKFIGGHSDLLMGAVVVPTDEAAEGIRLRRTLHGGAPGPMDAFLALRGMRTMPLRVRASGESAGILARRLADDPRVRTVYYPGLPSDPGHEIAARQMRGFGAMLSFCLDSEEAAERALERTELIAMATSLGGVETLAERRNRWPAELAPVGLIRLSVGVEHVEDIWADLDRALG